MAKLSPYQKAAVDAILAGTNNVSLNAVAGAGKTHTFHTAIEQMPMSIELMIISFAKAITDDHKKRVAKVGRDPATTVRTIHSLGLSLIKENGVKSECNPEYARKQVLTGVKPPSIRELDKLYGTANEPNIAWGALALCHLELIYQTELCPTKKSVDWLKSQGMSKDGIEQLNWGVVADITKVADDYYMYETNMLLSSMKRGYPMGEDEILAKFISNTDYSEEVIEWALWVNANKPHSYIGFSDMVCLPVRKFAGIDPSYREWVMPNIRLDYLFVDEVQDLSPVELYIVELVANLSKRIVIAGDPRQWVYGFKGTEHDAFMKVSSKYNCVEYSLPQTYRCDVSIVDLASTYVPHILPRDDAPYGLVEYTNINKMVAEIKPGDMVISRKIRHLIELAIYLLHLQKKVQLLDRGVGRAYMRLIPEESNHGDLGKYFEAKAEECRSEALVAKTRSDQNKLMKKQEKYENLLYIAQAFNVGRDPVLLKELFRKMDKSYPKDEMDDVINLHSVHQVKGTENKKVWLMLNPLITLKDCGEDPILLLEEQNIIYVGVTRAIHELHVFVVDVVSHLPVPEIIESAKVQRRSMRQLTIADILNNMANKEFGDGNMLGDTR